MNSEISKDNVKFEEMNISSSESEFSYRDQNDYSIWAEIFEWTLFGLIILSSVCFLVYLIASSKIPELKKYSGKNLVSLCTAFLCEYICAVFLVKIITTDSNFCIPMSWLAYYFSFANNLWMALIGFEMWLILRGTLTTATIAFGKQRNRFVSYSLISWLVPALALALVIAIDIVKPAFVPPCFVPKMGQIFSCWFNQLCADMLYYTGPILLLLSLSTLFLILAGFTISTSEMSKATTLATLSQKIQLKPFAILVTLNFIARIAVVINVFLARRDMTNFIIFLRSIFGIVFFVGFVCTGHGRNAVAEYFSKGRGSTNQSRATDSADYHLVPQPSTT